MTVEAPETIVQAKRNAARARARVDTDVAALQSRLHPRTLAQDAMDNVREKTDKAVGAAKRRPAVTAAAGGAVALVVLRKPLRGVYRLIFRRKMDDGSYETRSERKAAKKARKTNGSAPDSVAAPPDELIPHAAIPPRAATAKQE